jgi:site-specific DNA-methyltransferase (adenine-specific)
MRFPIIYVDPPWKYDNDQSGDPARGGTEYSRMTLSDLKDLRPLMDNITSRDCAMFMWATFPKFPEALELLDAWDMRFVTVPFVWVKLNKNGRLIELTDYQMSELCLGNQPILEPDESTKGQILIDTPPSGQVMVGGTFSGLGYWANGNAEIVILAKCGAPLREAKDVKQLIFAPVSRHSHKPDETRGRIVRMLGDIPRIELFSTERGRQIDGWIHAGLEVDGMDIRESLPLIAKDTYLSSPTYNGRG